MARYEKEYEKTCFFCGKVFTTTIPQQKYCCTRCGAKERANRERDELKQIYRDIRMALEEKPRKAVFYNRGSYVK